MSKADFTSDKQSYIVSEFCDTRILVIDEVSMLSPVMLAFIDLRLRHYVSVLTLKSILGAYMLF